MEHLEGANDPLQIARLYAQRRFRVHPSKQSMQPRDVPTFSDRLEPPPQCVVAPGSGEQAARQRAEVESRPAGENREASARVNVANGGSGIACVLRGGV